METEILMKLDENLVHAAMDFATRNNLGLQELISLMLKKMVGNSYQKFADMPIADWVRELSAEPIDLTMENRLWKERKKEYYESKL